MMKKMKTFIIALLGIFIIVLLLFSYRQKQEINAYNIQLTAARNNSMQYIIEFEMNHYSNISKLIKHITITSIANLYPWKPEQITFINRLDEIFHYYGIFFSNMQNQLIRGFSLSLEERKELEIKIADIKIITNWFYNEYNRQSNELTYEELIDSLSYSFNFE